MKRRFVAPSLLADEVRTCTSFDAAAVAAEEDGAMPDAKENSSRSSAGVGKKTEEAADVKDLWAEDTLWSMDDGRRSLPDLANADSIDEANDGAASDRLLSSDSPLMEKRRTASLAAGIHRFSTSS